MDSGRNNNFGRSGGAGGRGRGCGVGGRRRGNYQDQGSRRRGSGRGWNASHRDGLDLLSESKESRIQTLRRHERGGGGRWRDSPQHCPPRQLPTRVNRPPPLRRALQTPKQGQRVVAPAKPVQPPLQPHTPSQPGHPLIEGAWSKTWRAFCFTLSARLFLSLNCSLED